MTFRAVVCDNIDYDSIDSLRIPKNLQEYLRYYHYKQKLRVRTHLNSRRQPAQPRQRAGLARGNPSSLI